MDGFINLGEAVYTRFTTNIQGTFANMTPEKWIRVVIVAGTYMLLRPYLLKLGGRLQMKTYEKESAEAEEAAKAQISPNSLRGQVDIPEDSDEEEEEAGESTSADWGKKARRRQRDMIKKMLEAEERRLQETKEEEEDKDIEEYLVKE